MMDDAEQEHPVLSSIAELAERIAESHPNGLIAWTVVEKMSLALDKCECLSLSCLAPTVSTTQVPRAQTSTAT